MAYAAALAAGLALIWLGWAPRPFESEWLIGGGVGVSLAFILALLMRVADREGASYFRTPLLITLRLSSLKRIIAGALDGARRAVAGDPALHPALVRFKTRSGDEVARGAFANVVGSAPGSIVVEADEGSLLVHALIEEDADDAELRALEARAWGMPS